MHVLSAAHKTWSPILRPRVTRQYSYKLVSCQTLACSLCMHSSRESWAPTSNHAMSSCGIAHGVMHQCTSSRQDSLIKRYVHCAFCRRKLLSSVVDELFQCVSSDLVNRHLFFVVRPLCCHGGSPTPHAPSIRDDAGLPGPG